MKNSEKVKDIIIGVLFILFGVGLFALGLYFILRSNYWGIAFFVLCIALWIYGVKGIVDTIMAKPVKNTKVLKSETNKSNTKKPLVSTSNKRTTNNNSKLVNNKKKNNYQKSNYNNSLSMYKNKKSHR